MEVNKYLSFGAGVNSTALLLWLLNHRENDFECIFADTGCEYPETYEYIEMINAKVFKITTIKPFYSGFSNLYAYCLHYRVIPFRTHRWCTGEFKVAAMHNYYIKPAYQMIGFSAEEKKRVKPRYTEGIDSDFPLIEENIDRKECIEIIRKSGLPIPRKSGCFICPFQNKNSWIELRDKYPDLWCRALLLEKKANERRVENNKKPGIYFYDRNTPLEKIVMENQPYLPNIRERKPCFCNL